MDPPKYPVREQCPREGLVSSLKYYSKTRIDKIAAAHRRARGKLPNKKGTPQRVPFEMVDRTGLEPVTSCV